MKHSFLLLTVATLMLTAACNSSNSDAAKTEKEKEKATNVGTEFSVDTVSRIGWQTAHKGGLNPRYGTLSIDSGSLYVNDGKISSGTFTIQLKSIIVDPASTENEKEKSAKLAAHLLTPDFFDANKYPSVRFEITAIAPIDTTKVKSLLPGATNLVSGNLTIKDSTQNITFPAKITLSDSDVEVNAKFKVDRTSWGLNYKADGDPKNWMIAKDIELKLAVKAHKK